MKTDASRHPSLPRTLAGVFVAAALTLWLSLGQAETPELGRTLDSLLAYAAEHNPELRAERLAAQAAQERIGPAAALPDPMFQVELMDATNAMSNRRTSIVPGEVGETRYRVRQALPFWGKRELRGNLAKAESEQEVVRVRATSAELRSGLRAAYARYYQATAQTRILNETLQLAEAIERLALARYGVGLVPQQDAIQAQSEITTLKVELLDATRARREATAQLNALLPRVPDAPLAEPAGLPTAPPELLGRANETRLSNLVVRAEAESPELAAQRVGAMVAERNRTLTYRERYPDFEVGVTNNQPRGGTQSWDLMIEVNIPLQQGSRRAREREAERGLEAAQARIAAAQARLAGRIGEVMAAFDANHDKARLLRHTLLPQAQATLDAARAAYETGQVNFITLIEAERQIRRTRLSLLDAEVEAERSVAELEQLLGATL